MNIEISYQPSDSRDAMHRVSTLVDFLFYNTLGTVVRSEKRNLEQGINNVSFDASEFASGVYFVVPQTNIGRDVPTKFVKN